MLMIHRIPVCLSLLLFIPLFLYAKGGHAPVYDVTAFGAVSDTSR